MTGVPLDRVEERMREAIDSSSPLVREATGHVLGSGGKRFRPMLVLLSGRLGDERAHAKELIDCAAAIELTHVATLYHDDVMDEALLRHDAPTANARFENTVAILAGDWLFARASAIAADLGTYPSRILAQTIGAVCEGQIMEYEHTGRPDQSAERYLETIRRKTAALIAASCHLGAWIADAGDETVAALTHYGEALGMAFQLSDDVLDIAGGETGKAAGTDLREGVWTLPVLETLAGANPGSEKLRGLIEHGEIDDALELLRSNGSLERTREQARRWASEAVEVIVPLGPEAEPLAGLARSVSDRRA